MKYTDVTHSNASYSHFDRSYDRLMKILITGDSGVGKSAMLTRYTDKRFDYSNLSTIGVDFKIRTEMIDGLRVKLQIWDTAGQERFRTITSSYYRGAQGILVVYDCANRQSFNNIEMWVKEIERYGREDVVKILVANKCDCVRRTVKEYEGRDLANRLGMDFFETSAMSDINVEATFQNLTRKLVSSEPRKEANTGLPLKNVPRKKSKWPLCNIL